MLEHGALHRLLGYCLHPDYYYYLLLLSIIIIIYYYTACIMRKSLIFMVNFQLCGHKLVHIFACFFLT